MQYQVISKPKAVNTDNRTHSSINRKYTSNESPLKNQLKHKQSVQSESSVSPVAAASGFAQNFSAIPVRLSSAPVSVQPKLKIGYANDKYEQEADRVADRIMRMPKPNTKLLNYISTANNSIQRKCSSCEEEELVQRKTSRGHDSEISPGLSLKINSLSGGGRPMSASERGFFEPRFGSDFSNVRIHENSQANNMARSINARAFTLGNNIVFRTGEYSAESSSGKRLFAHELTHVVQQNLKIEI